MDAKELRAAAEYFDGREHETLDRGRVTRNLRLMVSHILATVPADDAEPVTVDSLRQQLADVKHSLDWLVGSLALIHGLDVADATPESVFQSCEDVTAERDRLRAELMQQPPTLEWLRETFGEPEVLFHGMRHEFAGGSIEWNVAGRFAIKSSKLVGGEYRLKTRAAVLAAVAATKGTSDVK